MKINAEFNTDDVEYETTIEPEEIPIEGNVLASGDDEADRAAEQAVRDALERGDVHAWCTITVTARLGPFEGWDSLGGVSVKNETDLDEVIKYHCMRDTALDHLLTEAREQGATITE